VFKMEKLNFPLPVSRALRKLGCDVRDARKRRRIPTKLMAERALMSRATLNKIEKGATTVSMGHYVTILFILGLLDKVSDLADLKHDSLGLLLSEEQLPQRIRTKNKS
jgi:transcriptional regulator with XRE-family HTH domain